MAPDEPPRTLADAYVTALAALRQANLNTRRWRSAALLGWFLVSGLLFALWAVW
jgi:hypothetical protein